MTLIQCSGRPRRQGRGRCGMPCGRTTRCRLESERSVLVCSSRVQRDGKDASMWASIALFGLGLISANHGARRQMASSIRSPVSPLLPASFRTRSAPAKHGRKLPHAPTEIRDDTAGRDMSARRGAFLQKHAVSIPYLYGFHCDLVVQHSSHRHNG